LQGFVCFSKICCTGSKQTRQPNALGDITPETFTKLYSGYITEQNELADKMKVHEAKLAAENRDRETLIVTESPIDALAHADIHAIGQTGTDGYRLSLGGVGSAALTGFLERNPRIQNIYLALDNDKAGKDAATRIIKELLSDKRFSHMKIITTPPPSGYKDYSDTLQAIRQLNIEKTTPSRSKEAAI
jgi:hypothetical protein